MGEEFAKTADEIFKLVGSKENILSVKNCKDSLKLKLKDKKKVDTGVLKKVKGVRGIIETQYQLQIIIIHINSKDIIAEFIKVSRINYKLSQGTNKKNLYDEIIKKNSESFKSVLKKVSSIFIKK